MTGPPAVPEDGRILAIRLSALGDIVFALPALRALRAARPKAHLAWLVEDRHAALLRGHPAIDELMVYPRRELRGLRGIGRLMKHLRALRRSGHWDLVVDFQSNLKSAMQVGRLSSDAKIGFDKPVAREGAQRSYGTRVDVAPRTARARRDLALVEAAGLAGDNPLQWIEQADAWPLPEEAVSAYADLDSTAVLLHVTTTDYGQDKAWLAERWAELANRLRQDGLRPMALWTPADRAVVDEIVTAADGALELAPSTPSLAHLMALTDRAAMLLGTDSGPLHLTARRGGKVVGLFGATDPAIYAPPGPKIEVVYPGAPNEAPPKRDRSCRAPWMERIDVDTVHAAAQRLLDS